MMKSDKSALFLSLNMKIYTKFGDAGETALFSGQKVPKGSPRIEATGAIDELNSALGIAVAYCDDKDIALKIKKLQGMLFTLGADISAAYGAKTPKPIRRIMRIDTEELEREIDSIDTKVSPLTRFILPGGCMLAAWLHFCRSVCRRAERSIVRLSKEERINPEIIPYMNRLSDLLFMLARYANRKKRVQEDVWRQK
jgi:cob(I)alamin adenosyltransferase